MKQNNRKRSSKIVIYRLGKLFICSMGIFLINCNTPKKNILEYQDHYEIEPDFNFDNSRVGGISGIDFDKKNDLYLLISDDRSKYDKARFYTVNIRIKRSEIDTVNFTKKTIFVDKNKNPYKEDKIDLESILYHPNKNRIVVGDEGGDYGTSSIKITNTDGSFIENFPLDKEYLSKIRKNKSFESICFSKNYKSFFYATEAPLLDDGNVASINNKGLIRIFESDFENRNKQKEFYYWLEKTPQKAEIRPPWEGTGSDNGLSAILELDSGEFLTLERSGAYQKDGSFKYICKVFLAKIGEKKLKNTFELIKKEILDFSKFPFGKYNIEGMTLGPMIDNKQSILFTSDNNFKETIPTVIYLFTITNK